MLALAAQLRRVVAELPGSEGLSPELFAPDSQERDGMPIASWWLVEFHESLADVLLSGNVDMAERMAQLGIPADAGMIGFPARVTFQSTDLAATRVTELLRAHGGLPSGRKWTLDLVLDEHWSFEIAPAGSRTPGWHVRSADVWAWSALEADVAVTALAAYATLALLRAGGNADHGAAAALLELIDEAHGVLPPAIVDQP